MNELPKESCEGRPKWLSRKAKIVWGFVIILPLLFFALLYVLPEGYEQAKIAAVCRVKLGQIQICGSLWETDYNTNQMPPDFLTFKDELTTPKLLHCPLDTNHREALRWTDFSESNVSYLIVPGVARNSTNVFVRCPYHHHAITAKGEIISERSGKAAEQP